MTTTPTTVVYVVGWNLPGHLPEMEPYAFDNATDAKSALADEMRSHADSGETWADEHDCDDIPCPTYGDDCPWQAAQNVRAYADECENYGGPEWDCIVGNLHYWTTAVPADEYEDEVTE